MEYVVVFFLIGIAVVWLVARAASKGSHGPAAGSSMASSPGGKRPTNPRRAQAGPLPPANSYGDVRFVRLSGAGRQAVVGESHYQPALVAAAAGTQVAEGDFSGGPEVIAALVPEPRNPHDRNAVRVDIAGRTVGYLPREDAARYVRPLGALAQRGVLGTCPARIMGGGDLWYGVFLQLAPPDVVTLANLHDDRPVATAGRRAELGGEQDCQSHLEAVASTLAPGAATYQAVAELQEGSTPKGKYAGEPSVEAWLDGGLIGRLSKAGCDRMLPILRAHRTAAGQPLLVEVTANRTADKGWQVTAHLPG